jgi:hypothetical protein
MRVGESVAICYTGGVGIRRSPGRSLAAAGLAAAAGCDPVLNVWGSFFPAWIVCLLAGSALAGLLRLVFAATGLEEGFAPLLLVYPALAFLLAALLWLAVFRS